MTDKMFILIPGAFNPPTIAHIKMSEVLHDKYPDAGILYLPARDEYITGWKQQIKPIPYSDRADILNNAIPISMMSDVAVCTVEKEDVVTGKTYDVVNWFKEHYKGYEILICIGDDKLKELSRWYKSDQLINENHFIVMTRDRMSETFPLSLLPYTDFRFLDFDYSDISSTKIREAYLSGQLNTVREFIPHNVYKYLQTHKDLFKECDTNV